MTVCLRPMIILGAVGLPLLAVVVAMGCSSSGVGEPARPTPTPDATFDAGADADADARAPGGPPCLPVAAPFEAGTFAPIPRRFECTGSEIPSILSCLFRDTGDPDCARFVTPDDAGLTRCRNCLVTSSPSDTPAPVISNGSFAELNVPGCLAGVLGDEQCAVAQARADACRSAACEQCRDAGTNVFAECRVLAADAICKEQDVSRTCVANLAPGGQAEICNSPGSFLQAADHMGRYFCADLAMQDAATD